MRGVDPLLALRQWGINTQALGESKLQVIGPWIWCKNCWKMKVSPISQHHRQFPLSQTLDVPWSNSGYMIPRLIKVEMKPCSVAFWPPKADVLPQLKTTQTAQFFIFLIFFILSLKKALILCITGFGLLNKNDTQAFIQISFAIRLH